MIKSSGKFIDSRVRRHSDRTTAPGTYVARGNKLASSRRTVQPATNSDLAATTKGSPW